MNGLNIDFESLNVSKSIKRQDNSPDISSLSFKYDESPDLSLSFSIQMDSAHNPLFNSPLWFIIQFLCEIIYESHMINISLVHNY
jgi:hypothetical protein